MSIETKTSAFELEDIKSEITKEQLGFGEQGFITIFKGNTEASHDWFVYNGRYSKLFGWFFPEDKHFTTVPVNVEPIKLFWTEISENNVMFAETKVKEIVNEKIYGQNFSEYLGNIGERITVPLTVTYVKNIVSDYGNTYFHIMEDDIGNVCTWTTNTRKLDVGKTYNIIGTVKELKKFKNEKQTILSHCRVYNIGA